MKARELKDFLKDVPDDADVALTDIEGKCIRAVALDFVNPVLYIECEQNFPEDWYCESGLELPWWERN